MSSPLNPAPFTVARGLAVQARHLSEHKARLCPEAYADLCAYVAERNAALANKPDATGYDVARGSDLDAFIANWARRSPDASKRGELTKRERALCDRPELQRAQAEFAKAAAASRAWDANFRFALSVYGGHGPAISGTEREHFPEGVKNRLRELAHSVTEYNERGRKLRPAGVRKTTMDELARVVCKRDGTGFYGY